MLGTVATAPLLISCGNGSPRQTAAATAATAQAVPSTPLPQPTQPPALETPPSIPTPSASPPQRAADTIPPAAAKLLLSIDGTGAKKTQTFTVSGPWSLLWSYSCNDPVTLINFQIFPINQNASVDTYPVNELTASGRGTTPYTQTGTFYLQISTDCTWRIRVTG